MTIAVSLVGGSAAVNEIAEIIEIPPNNGWGQRSGWVHRRSGDWAGEKRLERDDSADCGACTLSRNLGRQQTLNNWIRRDVFWGSPCHHFTGADLQGFRLGEYRKFRRIVLLVSQAVCRFDQQRDLESLDHAPQNSAPGRPVKNLA